MDGRLADGTPNHCASVASYLIERRRRNPAALIGGVIGSAQGQSRPSAVEIAAGHCAAHHHVPESHGPNATTLKMSPQRASVVIAPYVIVVEKLAVSIWRRRPRLCFWIGAGVAYQPRFSVLLIPAFFFHAMPAYAGDGIEGQGVDGTSDSMATLMSVQGELNPPDCLEHITIIFR